MTVGLFMKNLVWFCLLFLFLDSALPAKIKPIQIDIVAQPGKKKPLVLVLPFKNNSSLKQFPASAVYDDMIFKSVYNFTAPLDQIDMPPLAVLEPLKWQKNEIESLAVRMKADVVVYGDYSIKNIKGKQFLEISMHLWLRQIKADYKLKSYRAPTDRDIFNTLDAIIDDLTAVYLKIRLIEPVAPVIVKISSSRSSVVSSQTTAIVLKEAVSSSQSSEKSKKSEPVSAKAQSSSKKEAGTATLSLRNFQIGTEAYEIYLNDKLLDTARNNRFSSRLKLVAGQKYRFDIKHKANGSNVYHEDLVLNPDEEKEVFYSAFGHIKLHPLENKEQWKKYTYYIDQTQVEEGSYLSNQLSGLNYSLTVKDEQTNVVHEDYFYLTNGGTHELKPALKWKGGLHVRLYKTDETYAGVGADYMINRYLWAGAGCGVGIITLTNTQSVFTVFPSIECGYYLLGDLSYPYRMGVGAIGQVYYPFTGISDITNMTYSTGLYYGVGLFGIVEYLVFYLRPAVYYDFNWFRFQLAFGVKF